MDSSTIKSLRTHFKVKESDLKFIEPREDLDKLENNVCNDTLVVLKGKQKSGNEYEIKIGLKDFVENEPQNLNRVKTELESKLGIELSKKTLQRFLKNLNIDGNDSEEG